MADEKKENELASAVAALTALVTNLATKVEALQQASAPAELAGLKRTVGELATSFEQMKGVTKAAIEERERERQYLVRELAGNHRCSFGAEELESMPIDQLRKLGKMASVENWAGKGGPADADAGADKAGQRFAKPRPYFEKNKKEGE